MVGRVFVLARALIALPFLADVVKKSIHMAAQRALFESKALPADAIVLVMAVELVFGLMLLVGWRTRLAAFVLLAWSVVQALTLNYPHFDFGFFDGRFGEVVYANFKNRGLATFFKDVTTIGSLLIWTAYAGGPGALRAAAPAARSSPAAAHRSRSS